MRRSSYHGGMDRNYASKVGSKSHVQDINLHNFKLSASKVPENNFVSSRQPLPYYQPKTVKHLLTRPFTTQKTSSYLDYKSIIFSTQNSLIFLI